MEPKFQSSFIPKNPVVSSSSGGQTETVSKRSAGIFSVVAWFLFFITIGTCVGLFFYKDFLNKQIAEADIDLASARTAFQPEKIQELVDANSRIGIAKNLLEKHLVLSQLIGLLQELTLRNIHFSSLKYEYKENKPTISVDVEAVTYNALAKQEDIFSKSKFILNPVFSNFNLGQNGVVTMNFFADIAPSIVSYKEEVKQSSNNTQ